MIVLPLWAEVQDRGNCRNLGTVDAPRFGSNDEADEASAKSAERSRQAATGAVARFAEFPALDDPRPIVLLDEAVHAQGGFVTGDAKMAFLQGVIEAAEEVPKEPVRLMRVARLRVHPPRAPLLVRGAVLAEAAFATDRGRQVLPAWRVEAVDARGPIWVLAEEVLSRCWSPPVVPDDEASGPHILVRARIDPTGRDLAVDFVGGSETLFDYEAETVETRTAVTVVPQQRIKRTLPSRTAITAEGHPRRVHVRLKEPLGSRVLVNLDGTPVEAVPA